MMKRALLFAPLLLPLAACSPGGTTNISITDDDGNVAITSDESGRTRITAPGVDLSVKLPKVAIEAEDFDVNGVKLYPESKITNFDLAADDKFGEKGDAKVTIAFEAPASLEKVQAWFEKNMRDRGFAFSAKGSGFAGKTQDGDSFALELQADGADKAKGRMTVGA